MEQMERSLRLISYNKDGEVVKDVVVEPLQDSLVPMLTPEGYAHHLLHVAGVTRCQIFDVATGDIVLEQSDPPGEED
jgi:hypothetical protein